ASAPSNIITVASANYGNIIYEQLSEINKDLTKNILLEPCMKNTAAAIALAAIHAANNFDDPILWVIPSDHMIIKAEILKEAIQKSIYAARHRRIVVFGIQPTRPDS